MSHINNLRNRYNSFRDKDVSLDSFLFAVYEEERQIQKNFSSYKDNAFEGLSTLLKDKDESPLAVLKQIFSWYQKTYPDLSDEKPLNYSKQSFICRPFALLKLDLDKVLRSFSLTFPLGTDPMTSNAKEDELSNSQGEEEVSSFEAEDKEVKVDESVEVSALEDETIKVEKEGQSATLEIKSASEQSEDQAEEKILENILLRSELEAELRSHFPRYYDYMMEYFDWFYKDDLKPKYDFDLLPPSGRSLYLIKREFPSSELIFGRLATTYERPERKSFGDSKERFSKSSPNTSSSEQEKKAIDEAYGAIKKLKKDKEIKSVNLKPQNSFLRRLQHKVVSSSGYKSKSVGEEPQRSILILR